MNIPNGLKKMKHCSQNQGDHNGVEGDKSLSLCGHHVISDGSYT